MDNKTMAAAFEQQIQKYQNSKLIKPHKTWFWIYDVPTKTLGYHNKYANFGNEKPILVVGSGKIISAGVSNGLIFTNEKLYFLTTKDSFLTSFFFPLKGEVGSIPLNQIKDLRVGDDYTTLGFKYYGTQIFLNGKNIGLVNCGRAAEDKNIVNALEYIFKVFSKSNAALEAVGNTNTVLEETPTTSTNVADASAYPAHPKPTQQSTPPQQTICTPTQQPKKKKTWLWVLLGILAAIVAFVVCVGTTPTPELYDEEIEDQVKVQIVCADYFAYAFNGHTDEEYEAILIEFDEAMELVDEKYEDEEGLVTYRQIIKDFRNEDDENIAYYSEIWWDLLARYDALEIELSEFKEKENNLDYELYSFRELKRDLDFTFEYHYNEDVSVDCQIEDESFDEYIDNKINPG